ncbi:MAG: HD-GYP domain-containing protein [Planctomycetota bacterium]|jgi:HD-GYP domain-containing protein (c-di-GMP phosphodiesterase class II)
MTIDTYDHCELTTAPWSLGSLKPGALSEREPALIQLRDYAEATGLPFMCVDAQSGGVLARTEDDFLELLPWSVLSQLSGVTGVRLIELSSGFVFYVLPLPSVDDAQTVAVGYILNAGEGEQPEEILELADALGWSPTDIDDWCARQTFCRTEILERLLVNVFDSRVRERGLEDEIDRLANEVQRTYEEISILHTLTASLQLSRSPLDLAELCLDRVYGLIGAQGNAILIDDWKQRRHLLLKGHLPLDDAAFRRIVQRFETHDWSRPLVKNNIEGTLLGADFPGLKNFVLVPITDGVERSGWVMLCNLPGGRQFGVVEASLISSLATIMATHHRNLLLYQEHEDLLLQFVSSLISTLDAKDPYTAGHSERVGRIGRRLGQELGLPEEDLEDIYQAGLLHDVGKIGINDSILLKNGDLTADEVTEIRRHPLIGYRILKGLGNIRKLLPGVRSHHENYDGGGYPDGLTGEETPMLARILAVADSYDAMRSDRPYRKGLPVEKIEKIFTDGAGRQWDPKIIEAYFRARDDIREIGDGGTGASDESGHAH